MSNIVNNRKRKHSDVDETETHFLSLPNEILTKIFEKLSPVDREILASINARLNGLEKRARYRSFTSVNFNSGPTIEAESEILKSQFGEKNLRGDSLREIAAFFNRSTTLELEIEGLLDENDAKIAQDVFKSIHFEKLWTVIESDDACRIILDLLKVRTSVEEVAIYFNDGNINIELAKQLLAVLPAMVKCSINIMQWTPLAINDDIFTHIIANTSRCANVDCEQTTISSKGLDSAFEMVCSSRSRKEVHCFIPRHEVDQWIQGLDTSKFVVSPIRISHLKSGSVLSYDPVYYFPGMYSVNMNHLD